MRNRCRAGRQRSDLGHHHRNGYPMQPRILVPRAAVIRFRGILARNHRRRGHTPKNPQRRFARRSGIHESVKKSVRTSGRFSKGLFDFLFREGNYHFRASNVSEFSGIRIGFRKDEPVIQLERSYGVTGFRAVNSGGLRIEVSKRDESLLQNADVGSRFVFLRSPDRFERSLQIFGAFRDFGDFPNQLGGKRREFGRHFRDFRDLRFVNGFERLSRSGAVISGIRVFWSFEKSLVVLETDEREFYFGIVRFALSRRQISNLVKHFGEFGNHFRRTFRAYRLRPYPVFGGLFRNRGDRRFGNRSQFDGYCLFFHGSSFRHPSFYGSLSPSERPRKSVVAVSHPYVDAVVLVSALSRFHNCSAAVVDRSGSESFQVDGGSELVTLRCREHALIHRPSARAVRSVSIEAEIGFVVSAKIPLLVRNGRIVRRDHERALFGFVVCRNRTHRNRRLDDDDCGKRDGLEFFCEFGHRFCFRIRKYFVLSGYHNARFRTKNRR